jgi:uncharacterized repeat protein (TIGR02543 family)
MVDVNVSFDTGGGSALSSRTVKYNARIGSVPAPKRSGYDFAGWFSDAALSAPFNVATVRIVADTTLYAKWNAKTSPDNVVTYFTVTFHYGGLKANATVRVRPGSAVARPVNPVVVGKNFEGWYSDGEFKVLYDFASPVKKNITLYAKWANSSTISKPKPTTYPNVKKIRTPLKKIYLTKKKSYRVVTVLDGPGGKALMDRLTWTSSNKKVATVSASGKITAKAVGKAVVTAKARGGKTLKVSVRVVKKTSPLKKIKLKGLKKKMKRGKTAQIRLKLTPSKATNLKKVTFKSSKPSGLSVDKAGKVKAKKKGKYTVTVKVGNKKAKIKITVR